MRGEGRREQGRGEERGRDEGGYERTGGGRREE